MITAGVDIGSLSSKAAILADNKIVSWHLAPTGLNVEEIAQRVIGKALDKAGLRLNDVAYIIGTGYGRLRVPFAHKNITEISCHAKGAHWFFPEVRTILDLGGQDCKAIRCDQSGRVTEFVMNDKCAAGTGRYLERLAAAVGVALEEVGPLSLESVEGPVPIDSFCTVFAQRDVVRLLRYGKHVNDILAGACEAIVTRIITLLSRVGIEEPFSISGGVSKNVGVVRRLEIALGIKSFIAPEPQIVGAVGAALFARDIVFSNRVKV